MKNIMNQDLKVKDLTISELKKLISEIVKETIENVLEEHEALSSKNFIDSIKEAREEYKSGKYKSLEDIS